MREREKLKDVIKVFARETRSTVIRRTAGKVGFGGKTRHMLLNMFKFEMPVVHSRGDIT